MSTITKRDSGNWQAVVRRKGWPSITKTFRIKKDAEVWARITEDEIMRGIHIARNESANITVADALDRYIKEVTPTKRKNTRIGNRVQAKQLKSKLGRFSLPILTSAQIAAFRDQRIRSGKSNNTVRLELALLSHLYNTAIKEWGLGLSVNPVMNVKKPSVGNGRNRRLDDIGEETRLLGACKEYCNPLLLWIVEAALYTAMRKTEIVTLTSKNLNMHKRTITLYDTKNTYMRTVPMSDKAYATFEKAIDNPFRPKDTDLLFYSDLTRNGNNRRPYTFSKAWRGVLEKAEIKDFKFHDLRHEATSRLVEAGLP